MLVQGAWGKTVLGVGATVCVGTSVLAAATIWLLLTEPLTIASAVDAGDLGRLAGAVFDVVVSALRTFVGYL